MLLTFTKPQFKDLIKQGIKRHTIREDKHNRWKVGMKIHFWLGNPRNTRTKNKPHPFGEGVVSELAFIKIRPKNNIVKISYDQVNWGTFSDNQSLNDIAVNDGFENWEQMKDFFANDFEGKMIFWKDCVWS